MKANAHVNLVRRVGVVLIVAGALDIAAMIWCITHKIAYSSSFNIVSVISGALLLRGSMRAARVVRFISTVYGVALVCMLLAACVLQPASLTIAYLRLDPSSFINAAIMRVLVLSILFWGTRELTNAMALEAPGGPRKTVTPTRLAVLIGVALSVIVVWIGMKITNGQTGRHAKELAANQLGPGYEYYVTSLKEMSSGQGTSIKGEVTAWNDKELQTLSVQWQSVMPVK